MKKGSQQTGSISMTPMMRVPIANYAPPLLHAFLGIAGDLLLQLLRMLSRLDALLLAGKTIRSELLLIFSTFLQVVTSMPLKSRLAASCQ
jgi:hypothetical protein